MSASGAVLTIDPHVHSEGSYDGHEPVELILEHAADIGLDGVVVTDHDVIDESLRAAELASEYGLIGIPGVEVSTAVGHLLAIGINERPPKARPFDESVETIRSLGGIAVIPHPFQRSRHGIRKRNIGDCDGIEVYNSILFTGHRNRRANAFAGRWGFPKLGASDAHDIRHVGRAYTEVALPAIDPGTPPGAIDGEAVVEAFRVGETRLQGMRTPIHRSARQYGKGVLRHTTYHVTATLPYVDPWPVSMRDR